MEEAFRRYAAGLGPRNRVHPVYSNAEIEEIIALIEDRLAAQGLKAWEEQGRILGHQRARAALKELGPSLFPLIHRAEVRLTGARKMVNAGPGIAERYEIAGVVDVITHVELRSPEMADNRLVREICKTLKGNLPNHFEIIIDYKGTRRPAPQPGANGLAEVYHWQVQTYAHLRSQQEDSLPVAAGVILYLNELFPSSGDVKKLRRELKLGSTDTQPTPGSVAAELLSKASADASGDKLPIEFRLARAIHSFPVCTVSVAEALHSFDAVVARIEACRASERATGKIISAWEQNSEDEGTCAACDARTFCPSYATQNSPVLPGIK